MQVSEASVSRNRSTIIVPAGSTRDEGWAAFRNILAEINEASRLFILPNQVPLCFMHLVLPTALLIPVSLLECLTCAFNFHLVVFNAKAANF